MQRDGEPLERPNSLDEEMDRPSDHFTEVREFTFFVDAESFGLGGYDAAALAAGEDDLHAAGVEGVDIPTGYASDLGDRVPVRVRATAHGLRFYAKLLSIRDPSQLADLERICSAPRKPQHSD